jgi:hypothetical protein
VIGGSDNVFPGGVVHAVLGQLCGAFAPDIALDAVDLDFARPQERIPFGLFDGVCLFGAFVAAAQRGGVFLHAFFGHDAPGPATTARTAVLGHIPCPFPAAMPTPAPPTTRAGIRIRGD